jgi:hypothetical protein
MSRDRLDVGVSPNELHSSMQRFPSRLSERILELTDVNLPSACGSPTCLLH